MSSFKDFKSQMKSMGADEFAKQLDAMSGKFQRDERFWQAPLDDKKNSMSVIRFLPAKWPEKPPAVRILSYYFEGPGGLFREQSPATINQPDPVREFARKLWNEGKEDLARKITARTQYISNILVLKDTVNPDNEGKVFLFRYGKTIFNLIQDKLKPQYASEEKVNVFDLWKGANLKLRTCEQGGYVNYDKSSFSESCELYDGDDDQLKEVYDSIHPLQPFLDPSLFKSYDDIKALFFKVMGYDLDETLPAQPAKRPVVTPPAPKKPAVVKEEEDDLPPWGSSKKAAELTVEDDEEDSEDSPPPIKKPVVKKPAPKSDVVTEDVEDFFKDLD